MTDLHPQDPNLHRPQHPQHPQHPLANYQFNADELRVLRECNSESFFQRSLPFGTALGLSAYFGVKNGFLKPNVRYGAIPKVVVGVIVGYFLGKFSYQKKCMEKIMLLPNSKLADMLKKRQRGGMMETITGDSMGVGLATLSPFTSSTPDIYSDEHLNESSGRSTSLNLDTDRPTFSGLDDIYRPSLDNPSYHSEPEIPIEPAKPGTTYEELRQKNREEYMKKQQNQLSRPLPAEAPVIVRRQTENPKEINDSTSERPQSKNKYGDTWTN